MIIMRKSNQYQVFGKECAIINNKNSFRTIDKALRGLSRNSIYYSDSVRENIYEANKQANKIK